MVEKICGTREFSAWNEGEPTPPEVEQEAQLMLTTGSTRLAVSRGQQTWYHFGSIATFR